MENIDKIIDQLEKDKLVEQLQANSVRGGKINVRYTTRNQKYTPERLNELFKCHEKTVRDSVKGVLNIEKMARMKYRVPIDEERKIKLIALLEMETQLLFETFVREFGVEFQNLGLGDDLKNRIEENRKITKQNLEVQIQKLIDNLNREFSEVEILPPGEMSKLYAMDEKVLLEMGVVLPLQQINLYFEKNATDETRKEIFDNIQTAFKRTCKISKDMERSGDLISVEARKAKKLRVARSYKLAKDLVINVKSLLDQSALPPERRNLEMIEKYWLGIQNQFNDFPDNKDILENIRPLYEMAIGKNK